MTPDLEPGGLIELGAPAASADRDVDVIFVHGADGGAFTGWHPHEEVSLYWPSWLADDFSRSAVWALGYEDTGFASTNGSAPIVARAESILECMSEHEIGRKPLVLVAHSIGALLAKLIVRRSADSSDPARARISESLVGVAFLSAPHVSAGLAGWLSKLSSVTRATPTLRELVEAASVLEQVNVWFDGIATTSQLRSVDFKERQPTSGCRLSTSDESKPDARPYEVLVDCDHVEISKPASRNSLVYSGVLSFVQECLTDAGRELSSEEAGSGASAPNAATAALAERMKRLTEEAAQLLAGDSIKLNDDLLKRVDQFIPLAASIVDDLVAEYAARPSDTQLQGLCFSAHRVCRDVETKLAETHRSTKGGAALGGFLVRLQHEVILQATRLARAVRRKAYRSGNNAGNGGAAGVETGSDVANAVFSDELLIRSEGIAAVAGTKRDAFLKAARGMRADAKERLMERLWTSADVLLLKARGGARPVLEFAIDELKGESRRRWELLYRMFRTPYLDRRGVEAELEHLDDADVRLVCRCLLLHPNTHLRRLALSRLEPEDYWNAIVNPAVPVVRLKQIWSQVKDSVSPNYLKVFFVNARDAILRPAGNREHIQASIELMEEFYQVDEFHEGFIFQSLMELDDTIRRTAKRLELEAHFQDTYTARFREFFSQGARPGRPLGPLATVPLPIQRMLARRGFFTKHFICQPQDPIALECVCHARAMDSIIEFFRMRRINRRALAELARDRRLLQSAAVKYEFVVNPASEALGSMLSPIVKSFSVDRLRALANCTDCNARSRKYAVDLLLDKGLTRRSNGRF